MEDESSSPFFPLVAVILVCTYSLSDYNAFSVENKNFRTLINKLVAWKKIHLKYRTTAHRQHTKLMYVTYTVLLFIPMSSTW